MQNASAHFDTSYADDSYPAPQSASDRDNVIRNRQAVGGDDEHYVVYASRQPAQRQPIILVARPFVVIDDRNRWQYGWISGHAILAHANLTNPGYPNTPAPLVVHRWKLAGSAQSANELRAYCIEHDCK